MGEDTRVIVVVIIQIVGAVIFWSAGLFLSKKVDYFSKWAFVPNVLILCGSIWATLWAMAYYN